MLQLDESRAATGEISQPRRADARDRWNARSGAERQGGTSVDLSFSLLGSVADARRRCLQLNLFFQAVLETAKPTTHRPLAGLEVELLLLLGGAHGDGAARGSGSRSGAATGEGGRRRHRGGASGDLDWSFFEFKEESL